MVNLSEVSALAEHGLRMNLKTNPLVRPQNSTKALEYTKPHVYH
jgi:hypothetical protein